MPTTATYREKLSFDDLLKIIAVAVTLSTGAKPAANQDWYTQHFVNAKILSHVVTNGLQKLLQVTRIYKKKMNGLNKIQT